MHGPHTLMEFWKPTIQSVELEILYSQYSQHARKLTVYIVPYAFICLARFEMLVMRML